MGLSGGNNFFNLFSKIQKIVFKIGFSISFGFFFYFFLAGGKIILAGGM